MDPDDLVMEGTRASAAAMVWTWSSRNILFSEGERLNKVLNRKKKNNKFQVWVPLLNQSPTPGMVNW